MQSKLTDILCTHCGLCCDGSLFAEAELDEREEPAALEAMGLAIEDADGDAGGLLVQPCGALKGSRCTIYAHRPKCCRTFECRLLQEVKRGTLEVGEAEATIALVLRQIQNLEAMIAQAGPVDGRQSLLERGADALALYAMREANSESSPQRVGPQAALKAVELLLQRTLLQG